MWWIVDGYEKAGGEAVKEDLGRVVYGLNRGNISWDRPKVRVIRYGRCGLGFGC